jgi:phage terminase small subunit
MPALIERQIITEADLGTLTSYCVATSRIRELEALMRASFDLKLNRAQDASIKTARQLAAELGLTPVSRSRPSVRDTTESDDGNPLDV